MYTEIKYDVDGDTKIEQKKLKFNEGKCHQLHIGDKKDENVRNCPETMVHDKIIIKSTKDKYLGDIVTNDGKNHENIKERTAKGVGIISSIISILKELFLGELFFQTAMLFRNTLFLTSILLNAESWVNLTKGDIEELESLDRTYLRRVLEVPSSTPIPAL